MVAAAARLLESRSRSVADLRTRLARAGWPAGFVDQALERLADIGLLDDEAYARGWLESRDRGRPRGERVLRQELRLRGVAGDVAAAALDERREAANVEGRGGSALARRFLSASVVGITRCASTAVSFGEVAGRST